VDRTDDKTTGRRDLVGVPAKLPASALLQHPRFRRPDEGPLRGSFGLELDHDLASGNRSAKRR
jgi:hypothetical protein